MPSLHGVLLRVEDCGVLVTGPSGIGKSELALALVDRGHQLVADDAPTITAADGAAQGHCPEVLRDLMELRGLGVVNLRRTHGDGALADHTRIDLVIELQHQAPAADRIRGQRSSTALAGADVPTIGLPVTAGSSMALLVELAVRDHKLRRAGYQADADLRARQARAMEQPTCS